MTQMDAAREAMRLTAVAKCCRSWPVYPLVGWRRCGYCGTRPTLVPDSMTPHHPR